MSFRTDGSLNNFKRNSPSIEQSSISDSANIIMNHSAFHNCSIEESWSMNQNLVIGTTLKEVKEYIEDRIALGTQFKEQLDN